MILIMSISFFLLQTVLGDPQDAPLPELTDEDLEGLTDVPLWPSALLEQLDFTPAHWIDPPATSVVGTTRAEPVNHQPAAPASGSRPILIQASIHNPPGTVSRPTAIGAVATLLPDGSAAAAEYIAGGPCTNCCKDCVGKLTLVTTAVDVNSLTIGRQCKLGALSVKRIDSRFQTIEEQTKQSLETLGEIKDELVRYGLAIESIQQQILVVEAAVRVNTLALDRGLLISNMARKIWLIETTAQDNIRAYKAMSAQMTIMIDALDMLTMNR